MESMGTREKDEPGKIRRLRKKIRSVQIDLHYSTNMLEKVCDVLTKKDNEGPDYAKLYESMYHLWLFRVRQQEKRLKKLRTKLFGRQYG